MIGWVVAVALLGAQPGPAVHARPAAAAGQPTGGAAYRLDGPDAAALRAARSHVVIGRVVDLQGRPVAGCTLRLQGVERTTNAAGEFRFDHARAGQETLLLLPEPGLTGPVDLSQPEPVDIPVGGNLPPLTIVRRDPRHRLTSIGADGLPTGGAKPRVLGLSVVVGQVVDPEGRPVAGCTLRLQGVEATTNTAGEFRFEQMRNGLETLRVLPPPGLSGLVDLSQYERVDIPIGGNPPPLTVVRCDPRHRLTFIGADGLPAANDDITLAFTGSLGDGIIHLTTDIRGTAEFVLAPRPGAVAGWVHSAHSGQALLPWTPAGDAQWRGEEPVRLSAGCTITGRVVETETGRPVGGVVVRPLRADPSVFADPISSAETLLLGVRHGAQAVFGRPGSLDVALAAVSSDEDGVYTLSALAPGTYVLVFSPTMGGYHLRYTLNGDKGSQFLVPLTWAQRHDGGGQSVTVTVSVDGQTIRLPDCTAEPARTWRRVAGRVVDAAGQPVVSQPLAVALSRPDGLLVRRATRLDAAGRFSLWPVAEGEWSLLAEMPGREDAGCATLAALPPRGDATDLRLSMLATKR